MPSGVAISSAKAVSYTHLVNPNAELELLTTDSTTGVSGALDGTYTIGMASRELTASEVEGGAQATVLALDGDVYKRQGSDSSKRSICRSRTGR